MCGIAGYIGPREPIALVLEGLRHLEYRGYDSAGLTVIGDGGLQVHKVTGRVDELAASLPDMGHNVLGIGHTRWATHGEPSVANAHPHLDASGRFAVVHNGIIENAAELRAQLEADGIVFASSTDTEVLVHLIAGAGCDDLEAAVSKALSVIVGTYGIAVVDAETPDRIVIARNGSPVVIGIGSDEHFVASDVAAFATYTQRVVYLENQELAVVEADGFTTRGLDASPRRRAVTTFSWEPTTYETGAFDHFMQKEIHEQPLALERAFAGRFGQSRSTVQLDELNIDAAHAAKIRRIKLIGCGSAYYAGLAGAQLLERMTRIPSDAEPASEFRYREPIIETDTLYIAVSQSGETLDTLKAVEEIQSRGGYVVGVVNVTDSSLARACDSCVYLRAGLEISVTSTKSFNATVAALALMALKLGRMRSLPRADADRLIAGLERLPSAVEATLACESQVAEITARYATASSAFFIGRVTGFPIALEGSQKLKEVSYIHAEAYPCAELKHGPLALVAPDLPTFAIVPDDALFSKNMSTLEEIRARKGPIIAIGHSTDLKTVADDVILVPKSEFELDPLLLVLPLQLIAYHAAVALGLDVEKPRNLAKSVTVE